MGDTKFSNFRFRGQNPKAVEQYFTVVLFVFQFYKVYNFEKMINFELGTVRSGRVKGHVCVLKGTNTLDTAHHERSCFYGCQSVEPSLDYFRSINQFFTQSVRSVCPFVCLSCYSVFDVLNFLFRLCCYYFCVQRRRTHSIRVVV